MNWIDKGEKIVEVLCDVCNDVIFRYPKVMYHDGQDGEIICDKCQTDINILTNKPK